MSASDPCVLFVTGWEFIGLSYVFCLCGIIVRLLSGIIRFVLCYVLFDLDYHFANTE